ncbi:MAG TPA: hypothetical protein VD994_17990 [Prosthecobacter sp.]|nr:hypothetical protein [Prosthecobacter sp.]
MQRISRLSSWRRHKRPTEANIKAKSCYCLSNHFHRSGLEGRVCDELRLRKIGGDIKDYRVEQTLRLELGGCKLGTYRVDFIVEENDGSIEYVEAKGLAFAPWKKKWEILQHMHRGDPNVKFRVVNR